MELEYSSGTQQRMAREESGTYPIGIELLRIEWIHVSLAWLIGNLGYDQFKRV